jgi:hypothetical protein
MRALSRLGLGEHAGLDTSDTIERLIDDNAVWDAVDAHHPFLERIRAQVSFQQRRVEGVSRESQVQRAHGLAKQANLMLQSGDTSSAGSLFNTAGCIANANQAYEPALRWLMSAIPLLFAHGALMSPAPCKPPGSAWMRRRCGHQSCKQAKSRKQSNTDSLGASSWSVVCTFSSSSL